MRRILLFAGAVLLCGAPVFADEWRSALAALQAAEKERHIDHFVEAAARILADDSARAAKEVVESYGRFASGKPPLESGDLYRLHSELAGALGKLKSAPAAAELARLREKSSAWEARLVCLDAAVFQPEPFGLRKGALALLKDKAPPVERRALEYLKHDKTLPTVDAVLGRFLEVDLPAGPKGDEWNRLRLTFRSALTALVQVSLPAAVDYRNYVDARREKPEELFDKPPPPRGPTQLTIFGAEVTGNNLVFVIDVSGSMMATDPVVLPPAEPGVTVSREKARAKTAARDAELMNERRRITRAKRELTQVVKGLPDGKKFNIIAYSTDVVPWRKRLQTMNAESRAAALEYVAGLKADGITVTDDALEAAFSDLAVDTIYLITDGAPTHVGTGADPSAMPEDAEKLIGQIHRRVGELNYFRGVRVFTLGFPEAEENFLKKLAAENSGGYTPIR